MAFVRCSQGHVFDRSKHETCPTCGEDTRSSIVGDEGAVVSRGLRQPAVEQTSLREGVEGIMRLVIAFGLPGTAAACLMFFAAVLPVLWPPPPVPGAPEAAKVVTPSGPQGTSASGPVGTRKSDVPSVEQAAKEDEASLGDRPDVAPPAPGAKEFVIDHRDQVVLAFEDRFELTPLARELLATTRGCYAYGRKVHWLAKSWLTSAAAKSNPAAMYWYGIMLEKGDGVPQDRAQALRLITTAAEAGFYYAQVRLSEIYLKGEYTDIPIDAAKGKTWLITAAKEDRDETKKLLAAFPVTPSEIAPTTTDLDQALGRSYEEAYAVAETLMQQRNPSGFYWSGMFTLYGQGTRADFPRARALIDKAARLYVAPALMQLALFSADGYKTQKNPVEAAALAYLARENILNAAEGAQIDKVLTPLVSSLSRDEYEALEFLLKDITTLPRR